jgi:hypothetical protein
MIRRIEGTMAFKLPHLISTGRLPSLVAGTLSLSAALAEVDRAEQALEAARSAAKAAARREGRGIKNIFSEGRFVARASAERWCDTARLEGRLAGMQELADRLHAAAQNNAPIVKVDRDAVDVWHERMVAAGVHEALASGDPYEAAALAASVVRGEAIVRAGRKARMSVDPSEAEPPKGSLAEQIILAGKKRRGEV